jgi:uncharacterized membrane protein HdeD (DUF308 family)
MSAPQRSGDLGERRPLRELLRPLNLVQALFGLLALRLGVTVLTGHDVHHDQWTWLVPLLLVVGGVLVLASLLRRRRA